MKLKGIVSRRALAKQLNISVDTLRYQERIGTFKPIKKVDVTGRPLISYSDAEVRKAFEFYHKKNFDYVTEWPEND